MIVLGCVLALVAAVSAAPGGRIIGGSEAERGQFPYQISAQYCNSQGNNCQHSCGGIILSPNWILTAAHCITEVSGGTYRIIAGILNLTDSNPERQEIFIAHSVVHPQYAGGVNDNDIGLWKLERPLEFNEHVQPIALPAPGEETEGEVILSGWGAIGIIIIFPIMPDTLHTIDIPIVPVAECKVALDTVLNGAPHPLNLDSNICTGPLTGGISACSGDSGGPLVKDGKAVGIVSWGISPCGTAGAPSVYTKVSYFLGWIRSNVDDELL